VDFDSRVAEQYGRLRAALARDVKGIGPYDLLIAAQALAKDLALATNNQREFSRVKELRQEDWKKR